MAPADRARKDDSPSRLPAPGEVFLSDARAVPEAVRRAASRIERLRPHLAGVFHNALAILRGFLPLDEQAAAVLQRIALASEHIYLDIYVLIPTAAERGELIGFSELLHHLASCGPAYGRVLAESYPRLSVSLAGVAAPAGRLASACSRLMPASRGAEVLRFALGFQDPGVCGSMLLSLAEIGTSSPGAVLEIVRLIRSRLPLIDRAVFTRWVERGTALVTTGRVDEAVQFFMIRSRDSRHLLRMRHIVLEDLRNVLRIYCTSLAGRELAIRNLEGSPYAFKSPYTDGQSIFLPPEVDFFPDPRSNERVYSVMAAQQAASVSMGTFGFRLSRIDFEDELHDRYGTAVAEVMDTLRRQYRGVAETVRERSFGQIEVVFAGGRELTVLDTEHEKFFFSFPTPELARSLFSLVENSRIEHHLTTRYDGLRQDFGLLNRYLWEGREELLDTSAAEDEGSELDERLRTVLEALIQYSLMRRWKGDLSDERVLHRIEEVTRALDQVLSPGTTVYDSARVVFRIYNVLFEYFHLIPFCRNHDVRRGFEGLGRPEIHPEVIREASPDLLPAAGPSRPDFPDLERPQEQEVDITAMGARDGSGAAPAYEPGGSALRLYRYDEYDHQRGGYLKRRCTVYERVPQGGSPDVCRDALMRYRRTYQRVRKRFLAMQPEEVVLERRWLDGEEIHLADAVDYATDLSRGATPNEKIYMRKIKNRRDVAVAILIDASSSADEVVGEHSVIQHERATLSIMGTVLAALGDTFGLFAFNSMGPQRVFVDVIKDFCEPWDRERQSRISLLKAFASNRDGCAIRHAAARLAALPHRQKLLLLLSDGIPADVDYGGPSPSDVSEYSIEDTRRAIVECRLAGIVPYCLTIDRFARSYVPRLYGHHHYVMLDDVRKLPEKLSRLYMRLTR